MSEPKYPDIYVPMAGEDGNAFAILGRCQRIMRREGFSKETIEVFMEEAKAGDYDHLIATVGEWFDIWGED